MNPRDNTTITSHAGTRPSRVIITSAAITISLSASGSMNFPITVTSSIRRARKPSTTSAMLASANSAAAQSE